MSKEIFPVYVKAENVSTDRYAYESGLLPFAPYADYVQALGKIAVQQNLMRECVEKFDNYFKQDPEGNWKAVWADVVKIIDTMRTEATP